MRLLAVVRGYHYYRSSYRRRLVGMIVFVRVLLLLGFALLCRFVMFVQHACLRKWVFRLGPMFS